MIPSFLLREETATCILSWEGEGGGQPDPSEARQLGLTRVKVGGLEVSAVALRAASQTPVEAEWARLSVSGKVTFPETTTSIYPKDDSKSHVLFELLVFRPDPSGPSLQNYFSH